MKEKTFNIILQASGLLFLALYVSTKSQIFIGLLVFVLLWNFTSAILPEEQLDEKHSTTIINK